MSVLPTGTVTFLFTDIEGSTRLLQALGPTYGDLQAGHDALIRQAVSSAGGVEVRTEGDAFFVAFESAGSAVSAAVAAQRSLASHEWPAGAEVRVRMGLHTGAGVLGGDDYIGLSVHRAARVASIAHGGQVLLSSATASLVEQDLPDDVALRDLGGHLLKDLAQSEHIYQLVIGGLVAEFPPLATVDAIPNNLPTHLPTFVGRQRELAAAAQLLERARLVTFTGPGGTGKTRLAIQLAAQVGSQFPDGAFFVSLASIRDEGLVPSAITEALSIQSAGTRLPPLDQLLAYISGRRILLLLDNFEQVLGAAPAVAQILDAAPACSVLVTSRTPLRLSAEEEMPVSPLELPDVGAPPTLEAADQSEAVALFMERAQTARPDLTLDNHDLAAVAEVTIRLDGLPLAIELAAARTNIMTPPELLARLNMDLLAGGPQDVPSRQQTLRNTISWSYDLLEEPARLLFDRFSVFVEGATLEEALRLLAAHLEERVAVLVLIHVVALRSTAPLRLLEPAVVREEVLLGEPGALDDRVERPACLLDVLPVGLDDPADVLQGGCDVLHGTLADVLDAQALGQDALRPRGDILQRPDEVALERGQRFCSSQRTG